MGWSPNNGRKRKLYLLLSITAFQSLIMWLLTRYSIGQWAMEYLGRLKLIRSHRETLPYTIGLGTSEFKLGYFYNIKYFIKIVLTAGA